MMMIIMIMVMVAMMVAVIGVYIVRNDVYVIVRHMVCLQM